MRYVSAQLLAYLEDDLWLKLAARANTLASRIAAAAGRHSLHPVEANEIFVKLGDARIAALRVRGFEFYDWGASGSGEARFVVSWCQSDEDVDQLCTALREELAHA
jgi:threonine aldolase